MMFLDLERLTRARERVRAGDAPLAPAVAALERSRAAAIALPALSVCHKANAGPSGDPHHFTSIPTYAWPSAATGRAVWSMHDCDVNPAVMHTDVGRFFELVDTVEILALLAWYRDDVDAMLRAAHLIRTWFLDAETRMHPSLRYAQVTPGQDAGSHWGVIDFQRAYLLLDYCALIRPGFTDEDVDGLRAWFGELRSWLLASEQGFAECRSSGNHGTWFDVQFVAYSLLLNEKVAAREWLETVTLPRIHAHIDDDGAQRVELRRSAPIEYATFNAFGFIVLAQMGDAVGVDLWDREGDRITAAIEWLLPYWRGHRPLGKITKHRGTFTMFSEAAMVLRLAAHRFQRPDLSDAVSELTLHQPSSRSNLLVPAEERGASRPMTAAVLSADRTRAYPKVFVVGCPRSGTVWTRDILDRHPLTITGPESHLFTRLFQPLVGRGGLVARRERTLRSFDDSPAALGPERGPSYWLRRKDLELLLRPRFIGREERAFRVVEAAFDNRFIEAGGTPGHVLIEKTPDHLMFAATILRRWPEARIIEVLRDGRDVVASMGHMPWAPPDRRAQIRKWTTAVERAAQAKAMPETAGRWHVLRYERLLADTRAEIVALFDFLRLPWDDDLVSRIVHETEFTRMQRLTHDTTHRRRGVAGGWRDELTLEDIALFDEIAGDVLAANGYAQ